MSMMSELTPELIKDALRQLYQITISGLLVLMIIITLIGAGLMLLEWDGVLLFLFGQ